MKVTIQGGTDVLWPHIMLATECRNFISLTCDGHRLGRAEAKACLRLLPSSLESLELDTTFGFISEPSLQRLQRLTRLSLSGVCSEQNIVSAAGLECLPCLKVLNVSGDDDMEFHDRLDPPTFVHSSLTRLELARDVFDGPLDLTGLPALHDIAIYSNEPLPTWLMGQTFPRLQMWSVGQLISCNLEKLLFNQLEIICAEDDQDWCIQEFLQMPQLRHLQAVPAAFLGKLVDECTPLKLLGSLQLHQRLLQRVSLILNYPSQLQLRPGTTIPLRKNGHAVACVCTECLRAEVVGRPHY